MGNVWPKPANAVRRLAILPALLLLLLISAATGRSALGGQPLVPMPPSPSEQSSVDGPAPIASGEMRELWLRHHWTREELRIVYKIGEVYQPEALGRINWLLRDYRCNKITAIDPLLLDLLWTLVQELRPSGPVLIISAYRSEGYNASLLRAGRTVDPNSQHMFGRAVDVIFPGVRLDAIREAAIRHRKGGVGHYPFSGPAFLHLDTGPVRAWEEISPAHRRLMPVAQRARTRLRVDCDLKMADVLQGMPLDEAYAALPEGAASDIRRSLFRGEDALTAETDQPASTLLLPALPANGIFHPLASLRPELQSRRCGVVPDPAKRSVAGSLPSIAQRGSEAMAQQVALRSAKVALCAELGPCRIGPRRADVALVTQGYDLLGVALLIRALTASGQDAACMTRRAPDARVLASRATEKTRALRPRQARGKRLRRKQGLGIHHAAPRRTLRRTAS